MGNPWWRLSATNTPRGEALQQGAVGDTGGPGPPASPWMTTPNAQRVVHDVSDPWANGTVDLGGADDEKVWRSGGARHPLSQYYRDDAGAHPRRARDLQKGHRPADQKASTGTEQPHDRLPNRTNVAQLSETYPI
jgi:hypothetical protein